MKRIVKKAEERRSQILEKAKMLFFKLGYNNTTINIIIKELNISKGGFYHYFASKEELLDALANTFTQKIINKINIYIDDPEISAIDKLNRLFYESNSYKAENIDFILTLTETMYNDQNLLMRHKFQHKSLEVTIPLLAKIFAQGKKEGVFTINNPEAMARIILLFGMSVAEFSAKLLLEIKSNPEAIETMHEHFRLYQQSIEKILGSEEGTIIAFEQEFFTIIKTLEKKS